MRKRRFIVSDETNHNGPCFAIREVKRSGDYGWVFEWKCWALTRDEAQKYVRGTLDGELLPEGWTTSS